MAFLVGLGLFGVIIINDDFTFIAVPFRAVAGPGAVVGIGDTFRARTGARRRWFLLVRLVQIVPGLPVGFVQRAGGLAARVQGGRRWRRAGRLSAPAVAPVVAEAAIECKSREVDAVYQFVSSANINCRRFLRSIKSEITTTTPLRRRS